MAEEDDMISVGEVISGEILIELLKIVPLLATDVVLESDSCLALVVLEELDIYGVVEDAPVEGFVTEAKSLERLLARRLCEPGFEL